MKIKDIVTLTTTSITPQSNEEYHLYSLPSFDDNQKREELIGSEIQSNKYIVPDKCILFNKLNVRFKRVWRIDNNDYNKICSTEFLPLVVNESKVDYQYCYYILISDYITNYLCGQNANTSGSHKRIDPTDFLNIELPTLPAMEKQKRIGQLLFSLDQKIALNRAINDNLEAMAKQLYDYWFVQFDFPNEEGKPYKSSGGKMVWSDELQMNIPHNWVICRLNDYIDKNNTGDWGNDTPSNNSIEVGCIRGADILKLNNLPRRYIKKNNIAKLLSDWDMVIEVSGGSPTQATGRSALITPGTIKRNGGKITCSNFCHAFSFKSYKYSAFFFFAWKMFYVNDIMFNYEGKTSGIKNFMTETFLANKWVMPKQELVDRFFERIRSIYSQIDANIVENNHLTKQRDELLPLLMNGQVSVNYHLAEGKLLDCIKYIIFVKELRNIYGKI